MIESLAFWIEFEPRVPVKPANDELLVPPIVAVRAGFISCTPTALGGVVFTRLID